MDQQTVDRVRAATALRRVIRLPDRKKARKARLKELLSKSPPTEIELVTFPVKPDHVTPQILSRRARRASSRRSASTPARRRKRR